MSQGVVGIHLMVDLPAAESPTRRTEVARLTTYTPFTGEYYYWVAIDGCAAST